MPSHLPLRHVARVIVLDLDERLLLVRHEDAATAETHWVPPGGALEPMEDHRTAAERELREETGLELEIVDELWERRFELALRSGSVYQIERFFLARVGERAPAVFHDSPEDIVELRWWSLDDVASTTERIYPEDLLAELSAHIAR